MLNENIKKFLIDIWKFKIIWFIILIPLMFVRQDALFFIKGTATYTVALTIYFLLAQKLDTEKPSKISFIALNPALISSLFVAIMLFYICRTVNMTVTAAPFLLFALGLSADALFCVLAVKRLTKDQFIINAAETVQANFYFHAAVIAAIILGLRHFAGQVLGFWAVFYIYVFSVAAIAVFSVILNTKMRHNSYGSIYLVFVLALLGISFLVLNSTIKNADYFYCVAAGLISAFVIFVLSLYEETKGRFFNLSVLAILILIGNLWISFKFARGFGLSLCAIGFLESAVLFAPFIMREKEEVKNFAAAARILNSASFLLLLVLVLRLFIQSAKLYEAGINLNNGYFIVGLIIGLFLPVLIEGDRFLNPHKEDAPGRGIIFTSFNYLALMFLALVSIAVINIFLDIEPVCAVLMGLAAAGAVSFAHLFIERRDDIVWSASLGSLWIFTGFAAYPMIKRLSPLVYEFSRLQKIEIAAGLLLIILVFYLVEYKVIRVKTDN